MDEAVEEPVTRFCLTACPKCAVAHYSGGACHLDRDHSGQHECNAAGGEMHNWQ
jgi:hypothetical protein